MLPGKTKYIRNPLLENTNGIGIIPIKDNTRVRTFGLRWNLGELLLLSNIIR